MSEYRNLKGKKIKFLTADLSGSANEGEVYYLGNPSGAGDFKSVVASEAWSSGGSNFTKHYAGAGGGTQTAGLIFGGNDGSGNLANTTEYNGVGFATGGDLNTARDTLGGAGTATAALAFGGENPSLGELTATEEFSVSTVADTNLDLGQVEQ